MELLDEGQGRHTVILCSLLLTENYLSEAASGDAGVSFVSCLHERMFNFLPDFTLAAVEYRQK